LRNLTALQSRGKPTQIEMGSPNSRQIFQREGNYPTTGSACHCVFLTLLHRCPLSTGGACIIKQCCRVPHTPAPLPLQPAEPHGMYGIEWVGTRTSGQPLYRLSSRAFFSSLLLLHYPPTSPITTTTTHTFSKLLLTHISPKFQCSQASSPSASGS